MNPRSTLFACLAAFSISIAGPRAQAADSPPSGFVGRYSAAGDPPTHVDIRADGTFSSTMGSRVITGTYAVKDHELILTVPDSPETPPLVLRITPNALVREDGEKIVRTGEALSAAAANEAAAKARAAGVIDPIARMTSMNHVKQLCTACRTWAGNHEDTFPDSVDQLRDPKYLGAIADVLRCPLLHDDSQTGYVYLGKGLPDSVAGKTILFLSKWTAPDGRRIIGHVDASVTFEIPRQSELPPTVGVSFPNGRPAAPTPPGATPSGLPPGAVRPSVIVTPEQAGAHVGEVATVKGVAASVEKGNNGNLYLNFGGRYPNQVFTAFVPPSSGLEYRQIKSLEGKEMRVTGRIVLYNGRPQIVINQRSQVAP